MAPIHRQDRAAPLKRAVAAPSRGGRRKRNVCASVVRVIGAKGASLDLHPSFLPSVSTSWAQNVHGRCLLIRNRKKIRCTGKKPCALCVRQGLSCEYNARYTRGRVPSIESDDAELTHQGLTPPRPLSGDVSTAGEQQSQDVPADQVDHPEAMEPANTENLDAVVEHAMESAVQSSRNSPEPSQTDRQGHYVGPSSGLSFLLRAQKRLHKIVSLSQNSSIFTFGDTPLPDFDSSFFVLPPKERAAALVARYFDFAFPTHRFLHRPTVELWLEELYGNLGVMRERVGEKGKRAVLFMVLAQAEEYMIRPGDEADYQRR